MNKFDYSIDEEMALLEKYALTPTELFVVKMLLLQQEDYPENYLSRFLKSSEDNKNSFRNTLTSLRDKGIILKSYKIPETGQVFDPLEVPINKNFFNTIFRSAFDLGKELFEHYPMFGEINGTTVSLRGISKKFDSLEDFFRFYGKQIKWNPETHKKVLDLIDWEQKNNIGYINFSLATFVIENKWAELEALKNGKITKINFNAIKQL